MKLEALANGDSTNIKTHKHYSQRSRLYPYQIRQTSSAYVIEPLAILQSAFCELTDGMSVNYIAAKFHHTVADIVVQLCGRLKLDTGIKTVCLAGGVFQNMYLLQEIVSRLKESHFQVFIPQQLPTNDGGLSLGQAVSALSCLGLIDRPGFD